MKRIEWLSDSKEDLSLLPPPVKRSFGYRLREIQKSKDTYDTKPLFSLGHGVYEMRESYDTNAYRLMYIARLEKAVYVLDVFMKKSKTGIGLPKQDIQRIQARLKRAILMDKE